MANIKVSDINPAGTELFADSESFMNDVSNDEIQHILGGRPDQKLSNASYFLCNPGTQSTRSWFACYQGGGGINV